MKNQKVKKSVVVFGMIVSLLMSGLNVTGAFAEEAQGPESSETKIKEVEEQVFFEDQEDLNTFSHPKSEEVEISTEQSRSGLSSYKLSSRSTQEANKSWQFEANKVMGSYIQGKTVSIWFYDSMDQQDGFLIVTSSNNNNDEKVGLGVNNSVEDNKGQKYYYFRDFGGKVQGCTTIERTEGWHNAALSYTSDGKVFLMLDQQKVHETSANGFDKISVIDYWGKSRHSVYLDDLEILSGPDLITQVPVAPTNPITNNEAWSFGFTEVPGYNDISLYEYSVDGGIQFKDCVSNPQPIEEGIYEKGQVLVRLKETENSKAGAVLRSTEAFKVIDKGTREELEQLYNKAETFYEHDYEGKSWIEFKDALVSAKVALDQGENYGVAEENLSNAINNLSQEIPDEVKYGFEMQDVGPFTITSGTLDWGQYTNVSSLGKQALRLLTQDIAGVQTASIKYSFAKPLTDEFISFYFRDTKVGSTKVTLMDSKTNNGIIFYGGSKSYYYKLVTNGVESEEVNTEMRRNNDWYNLELNLGIGDGIYCSMDSRPWLSTDLLSEIDTIEVKFEGKNSFLTIDDFTIRKQNPVTKLVLNTEEVTLGYYDTFEMNINNMDIQTEKPYKTSDLITYQSENTDVATVTSGGSIECVGTGTTVVTATATSGVSTSIKVICEDKKVEDIAISSSDYNDVPEYITSLKMTPGQKKVVNAILTPDGVTNRDVIWTSDNEAVIKVNNGELTAVAEGVAKITAESKDIDKKATITVTVQKEQSKASTKIYIAKGGDDYTGDGSEEKPFKTIERARDEVRTLCSILGDGVDVCIHEGTYTILDGVEFDEQDSGTKEAPITYTACDGESVTFSGSITVDSRKFSKVTDTNILEKLPETSKDKVYVYDLSDLIHSHKGLQYVGHSITNMMWLSEEGKNISNPYYSVSVDGAGMTLSRWPNVGEDVFSSSYPGFTKIDNVIHAGARPRGWLDDIMGRPDWVKPEDRDRNDVFEIQSEKLTQRMKNWTGIAMDGSNLISQDIWMMGYWYANFSDQSTQVRSIKSDGTIESDTPSAYGVRDMPFTRFFVYNLIQELDVPGEWYFDQSEYKLYIYPPNGVDMNEEHLIKMAALEDTMLTFNESAYVEVNGINMEGILGHAVEMKGTDHVVIKNALITATELQTANITDGESGRLAKFSGFDHCDIRDVNGGINISGGDFNTLESQGNFVNNCTFKNYATVNRSYNPAVNLGGVGNRVSSCKIEDGPHNSIMYTGDDHVIEFTEFTDVLKEAKDQGAIDTARNELQRGNVIRNCYFHDIPEGTGTPNCGIYLDDLTSGVTVIDNTFENMGWGLLINGGRDNTVIGNQFINCGSGVIINDWGYCGVNNWNLHGYGTIANPFTMEPTTVDWSNKNGVYGKYKHLWCIREDNPYHSKYNKVIGNSYSGENGFIYYMSRGVQANFVDVLNDWYFMKDNN